MRRGDRGGSVHAGQDVGLGEVVLVARETDGGGPGPHVETAEFPGPPGRALWLFGALLAIRLLRCHRALLVCRIPSGAYRTAVFRCSPPVRVWMKGQFGRGGAGYLWSERADVLRLAPRTDVGVGGTLFTARPSQINQMSGPPLDRECKQGVTIRPRCVTHTPQYAVVHNKSPRRIGAELHPFGPVGVGPVPSPGDMPGWAPSAAAAVRPLLGERPPGTPGAQ